MTITATQSRAARRPAVPALAERVLHGIAQAAMLLLFWRRIARTIAQIESLFDLWRTGGVPLETPAAPIPAPTNPSVGRTSVRRATSRRITAPRASAPHPIMPRKPRLPSASRVTSNPNSRPIPVQHRRLAPPQPEILIFDPLSYPAESSSNCYDIRIKTHPRAETQASFNHFATSTLCSKIEYRCPNP